MKTAKGFFLPLTSLLIAIIFAPSGVAQTTEPTGRSIINVRAIYQDTERPVRRAPVQIYSDDFPRVSRQGVTDGRGEFSFKNVPEGQYRVTVGFASATNGFFAIDDRNAVKIDVDGTSSVGVKIRTERSGAITGKVTYPDGEPAIDAQVNVLRKSGKRWEYAAIVSAAAHTDDRGIYRIYPLPPGEYVIGVVEQSLVIEQRDGGTMQTTGNKSLNPYYYGGASHYANATLIQVDSGREVTNINVTLAERATFRIAGTVVAGGMPLAGTYLRLQPHEDGLSGPRLMIPYGAPAQADKDGKWLFTDVPDGIYDVELDHTASHFAVDGESKSKPGLVGRRQLVTVSGADVSDLVISLSEGGQVSGSIVVEGDKPLPRGGQVSLQRLDKHSSLDEGGMSTQEWSKGLFAIEGVPAGEHFVTVRVWDQNYFVKSITWNNRDLLRQPIKVTEGSELKNVRILLSRDVGTVAGHLVSAETKKPLGKTCFLLVPTEETRWDRDDSYVRGYTDKDGSFKITGPPGEYLMLTQPRSEPASAVDFIRERSVAAPHVTLKAGEQADLEIAMPGQ